ncbi:hypothetical protein ACNFU2_07970 [Chryseobacterium sp. PTM-20240506]|uniref:hypothetical protein n=1 Tax=unclassified Chryseobacterium TaxID=2593645 RepID=UPI0027967962|nr:hypothetical protein [Chryseobacterium sp. CKR4-1]MDQ1806276.1 hypothetical protein [Chryseobacterium sp. CKR4-1]
MLNYQKLLEPGEKKEILPLKAYEYGIKVMHLLPRDLNITYLQETFNEWIRSEPWQLPSGIMLGSVKPSIGLDDDQPKAYWKSFPDKPSFYRQLIYDSHPSLRKNKQKETELAIKILSNEKIAAVLNELRRAIAAELWKKESISGKLSYYLTTNPIANLLPNMGGSYNLANSYPRLRTEPTIDNIGSIQPLLEMMFIKTDRISLAFSEKDFTVSENIAILHDIKELFSPRGNSRALPTAHPVLIPHPYQGKNSPPRPMRWELNEDFDYERVAVLQKNLTPFSKDPKKHKGEIKWDQGRLGAGTRNEASPDTIMARRARMPIETGRSHTAARLFEMVSLLKPASNASIEEHKLFKRRIQAIAYGIFAYWNAPNEYGGYPKSLTPIHTYHEVMDPAEDYAPGIYSQPFSYEDLKDYLQKSSSHGYARL